MRPYNEGSDFPTLLALIVAVGFPLLFLSLVFDLFPRDQVSSLLTAFGSPLTGEERRPVPSPQPVAAASPAPVRLTAPDWPISGGRFFTQTNGRELLSSATGYAVTNSGNLRFWDEFQRLGGVESVGYPLSNRFTWRGFTIQVFQKLVFQGPEQGGEISILNVMDDLSAAGKDEWLRAERFTPLPLGPEADAGKSPGEIMEARMALLAQDPEIEKAYKSVQDPLRQFGLPTSPVTDMGEYLVAIRCQRAVLQRWKKDMDWARAGEVTIANAGQIAREAGLFPAEVFTPVVSAPPTVKPSASPAPASS